MATIERPSSLPSRPAWRRRPSWRQIGVVGAVWVAVAGGAIGLARYLDQPSGPKPAPPTQAASLPPLSPVLARPAPARLTSLDLGSPAARATALDRYRGSAADLVQLGALVQRIGDPDRARLAYSRALRLQPGRLDAMVALANVAGAGGGAGLERAAGELASLARTHPRSQLVAFNQGWVAVYRRRGAEAVAAFRRAAFLGRRTPLGQTADQLADRILRP